MLRLRGWITKALSTGWLKTLKDMTASKERPYRHFPLRWNGWKVVVCAVWLCYVCWVIRHYFLGQPLKVHSLFTLLIIFPRATHSLVRTVNSGVHRVAEGRTTKNTDPGNFFNSIVNKSPSALWLFGRNNNSMTSISDEQLVSTCIVSLVVKNPP